MYNTLSLFMFILHSFVDYSEEFYISNYKNIQLSNDLSIFIYFYPSIIYETFHSQ